MTDPLGELKDSLAYMFELQKTRKTGKYINPLVQNLHLALDNYRSDSARTLNALIAAIKKALPVIENYVDSFTVRQKMEVIAGTKGETIRWYTSNRPGNYPQFQFAGTSSEEKPELLQKRSEIN